jgi:hypothetical protein
MEFTVHGTRHPDGARLNLRIIATYWFEGDRISECHMCWSAEGAWTEVEESADEPGA